MGLCFSKEKFHNYLYDMKEDIPENKEEEERKIIVNLYDNDIQYFPLSTSKEF